MDPKTILIIATAIGFGLIVGIAITCLLTVSSEADDYQEGYRDGFRDAHDPDRHIELP